MENASKALLISATVLIAIVIIALGIKLIGSGNDTSKQAKDVSDQLAQSTAEQGEELIINDKIIDGKEYFAWGGDYYFK